MGNVTFYRVKKDKNYTVISNQFIKDTNLSLQAKGLFTLLLSLPEDWNIRLESLVNMSKGGMCSLRSAIKELEENGYFKVERLKDEHGRFTGTKYYIDENPEKECSDAEKPFVENPNMANRRLLNTKKLNTNTQNTHLQNTCPNTLKSTPSNLNSSSENLCTSPEPNDISGLDNTSVETQKQSQIDTQIQNTQDMSEYSPSVPKTSDTQLRTQTKNTKTTKLVSSTPASAKQKCSFPKNNYTECRQIIYNNKKSLNDKGIQVEKAEYDIRFVNSKLKKLFESFGVEQTKQGLLNSVHNDWLISIGYTLNGLLSEKMFAKYIANEQSIRNDRYVNKPRYKVFEDKKRVYNDEEGRF